MRIAYITETWLPSVDGIVTRLTATLTELRRAGHEVLVVAPNGEYIQSEGITVRGVPTIGFGFLYGGKRWGLPIPRVARYLREFDPDVVHVLNPVLLGVAGVLAARRQRRALVTSYHTDLARYVAHYHLGWSIPALWALQRGLHRAAHVNLATSDTAVGQLTAHGVDDVALWQRGVDLHRFHPAEPIGTDPAAPGRTPVALYVGRLAEEKGLQRLAPLAERTSGIHLTIVGDGPARDGLQRRFGDAVTFTGTLHGAALAEAYRTADVFVFPSTTDTLGLVLLEALASGLPVIAAECPASRETLTGCPATRLFPAEHPDELPAVIGELLASAPRDTLARYARAHARRWDWHHATAGLLEHYQHALTSAPSAPGRDRSARALTAARSTPTTRRS